jgi:hypothetical protein
MIHVLHRLSTPKIPRKDALSRDHKHKARNSETERDTRKGKVECENLLGSELGIVVLRAGLG